MPRSLGAHSPKLDGVRALRAKEGRSVARRFTVEGPTMLAEALRAGSHPEAVYATQAAFERLGTEAAALEDRLFVVPDRAMERMSDLATPPGVVAVFESRLTPLDDLLAGGEPAVVLAGVADPGNAGTLLRTAEIFGIERAIFAEEAVEPYNPKVVRATMGAIFRMRLAVAGASATVEAARRHGYAIAAAVRTGEPLPKVRFPRSALIAIGSERHGVASWLSEWDLGIAIPQLGEGDSLNAAVAGGIILYAFSQQLSRKE